MQPLYEAALTLSLLKETQESFFALCSLCQQCYYSWAVDLYHQPINIMTTFLNLLLKEPLRFRIIFSDCPWTWTGKIYNFISITSILNYLIIP